MVAISLLMEMGQFDHFILEAYMFADLHQLILNYANYSFPNPPILQGKVDSTEVS